MNRISCSLSLLPDELLIEIVSHLDSDIDLSSLCRSSRQFHWLFFDRLFDSCCKRRYWGKSYHIELFYHAVKHDSTNIIRWLTHHGSPGKSEDTTTRLDLTGFIPSSLYRQFSFLHFALLGDAPKVAAHLLRLGADISQNLSDYSDLTPLYLTIARSRSSNLRELDFALRIACSYALPRTVGFLLARGADPNSMVYGTSAFHVAVSRRLPWPHFELVDTTLYTEPGDYHPFYAYESLKIALPQGKGGSDWHIPLWQSMIIKTATALLEFGADIHLQTSTSRLHTCGYGCFRSLDCDHRGQTALHLACASGNNHVVSHLLDYGADPTFPNEDGYSPLYTAIMQGQKVIASTLIDHTPGTSNPIVYLHHETTALHVACRCPFPEMVSALSPGYDEEGTNVRDLLGVTPLHEAVGQTRLGTEAGLVKVLEHLARQGAHARVEVNGQSAWDIAVSHPFKSVRDLVRNTRWADEEIYERHASLEPPILLHEPKTNSSSSPDFGSRRHFKRDVVTNIGREGGSGAAPNVKDTQAFPSIGDGGNLSSKMPSSQTTPSNLHQSINPSKPVWARGASFSSVTKGRVLPIRGSRRSSGTSSGPTQKATGTLSPHQPEISNQTKDNTTSFGEFVSQGDKMGRVHIPSTTTSTSKKASLADSPQAPQSSQPSLANARGKKKWKPLGLE